MYNNKFEAIGAGVRAGIGARAASHYGSGSTKMMRLCLRHTE
jgi:hypothetical protein